MASMYRSGASRRKAETPGKIRIQLKGKNTVVINNDTENLDDTGEKNEDGDNGSMSFENGIPTSLPEGTCIVQPEPVEETPQKKKREAPVKIDTSVLDNVACTACGRQVNPYKSGALHKHPILKVVICRRCERFVTSSVISKDKAGADTQCRWCGEAGRLVVCDECSTAFCKSCVMRNFNRSEFNNINGQENWKCYMCNKSALQPLRDNYRKIKDTLKALQEKDKSKSSASAANATDHSGSTEKLSGGKQASKVVSTGGPLSSSQKTPSINSSVSAGSKSSSLASPDLKKTPSSFQSGQTPSTVAHSGVKPSPLAQPGPKPSPAAQSVPKSSALNQSSPSTSTPQATPSLKTASGVIEGQKNSSQPEKSGSSHQTASSLSADRKSLSGSMAALKTPAQVEGGGMAAISSGQRMNSGSMSAQKMSHFDGLGSSSHKMYSSGSHKSSSRYDSMGGYSPSGHKYNSDLSHKFFSGMGLNNIIFNLDDMNITFENVFSNISKLAIATNTFSEMLHVLQSQSQLAMSGNVNMQALRIHCVKTLNMGIESYLKSLKTILSGSPYLSDSMMYTAGMLGGLGSSSLSASEALALSRLSASPGMMSMGSNMGFHPNGDIDSYLLQQSCSPSGSASTRHTSSDVVPETNKSATKESNAEEPKPAQGVVEAQEPQSIKEESSNNQPEATETPLISSVENAQTSNAILEHPVKIKQEPPVTEVITNTDGNSLPKTIQAEKLPEPTKGLPEEKSLPGENKTNTRPAEKLNPEYKKKLSLQMGSDFSNKLSKKLMEKDLVLTSQPAVVPMEQPVDVKFDLTKKVGDETAAETDVKDINTKSACSSMESSGRSKDSKKQKDAEAGAVNIKEDMDDAADETEQQDAGEALQAVSEDEVDLSTRIQRKKKATSPARSPARGESQTAKTAPTKVETDVNSGDEVSEVEEKAEGSSPASSKHQAARKRKPASSEVDMAACEEKKIKVEAKSTGTALKKSKPGPKSSKTGTDYVDHCVVETEQEVKEEEAEVSDGEDEPPVTFYLNPADEEEIVDDGSALEIGWTEEVVDNEDQIIQDDQLVEEEEVVEEKKRVRKSKKSPKVTAKKLARSDGSTVANKNKRKKQKEASKVNLQEQSSESESDKDKPKKKKKNNNAEDEDEDPDKLEESLVSSIDSEEVSDSDEAVDSEEVEIGEEEAEVGEEEEEAEGEEEEEEEPKSKKKSKGKTPPKGKRKKKKVKKAGDDDDDEEEDKDDESEEESKKTTKKKGKGKKAKKVASSDEDEDEADEKENKEGDKDDDDDEDDDDPSSSKAGKRKQIRKVMSNKRLEDSTRAANRAEEKRRKRIAAKQREFNIETITDENNPMKCIITTKLVLEPGKEEGDEPIVQVNKKLVRKLKPHQVEAVQFMWDCMYESVKRSKKEPGAGCILAHCMGLGKTLSVITFVHTILSHEKVLKHRTCLVVSPLNTVLNWRNEWSMWLDEEDRLEVWELASCKQNAARVEALKEWQASGGIMIMGYEMYRNLTTGSRCKNKRQKKVFQDTLVDPGPDLVICDEGHILKNEASAISKAMNQMKTKRRVVLTGTPLQNNLNEYHCMVSFVKPSLLGTRKEFNNRFISPIQNGQCTDSNSRDVKIMKARAHVLHEMLAGCVQRRDYSALTKFLPPKQEYVISVRLTSIQIELYEKYLQMTGQGVDGVYSNKGARLFADYQNLMKIWTHPWVLKLAEIRDELKMKYDDDDSFIDEDSDEDRSFSSSSSSSDDENAMSDGGKKGSNLKLNMQRGTKRTRAKARRQAGEDSDPEEVIAEWKSKSRTSKQGDDDGKAEEPDRSVSKDWWAAYVTEDDKLKLELSNKLHLLFEILRMCEEIGDKVLIFSQSILSLNIIESFLEVVDSKYQQECETLAEEDQDKEIFGRSWTKNMDYYRMDGTTSAQNRQLWASNFNDIDNYRARLFLISTRAGGLGINLVAANRVIIFDASWNPSHDVQSIFRVYRFGQTKPCYIYRFLAQGTMEEKIYERQVTKLSLSQRVVDEHQIERHFSANDLKELYNFRPERWDDGTEKPTLALPKDPLLAEILVDNRHCVVSFHEHDSLLENQIEQTLTEEEKKAAWEEYENEKKGIIIRGPGMERTASWPMMAAAQILSREQIQATVQALRQQLPDISEELFHLHLQQALRRQVQIKQEEMRRMELLRLQEMNYLNMIKQQAQQSGLTHAQSLQAMQNMAPWMQIQRLRAMQQSMLMGGGHYGMLPSASMSMLGQSMAGSGGLGGSKQDDSIDLDNN